MANLKRPGGELASRPLHFIWVVDCSGSMYGEKIGAVNHAIQSTIPEMVDAANDNPNAQLLIRTLKFSTGASWVTPNPVNIEDFAWDDLEAGGITDLGKAYDLLAAQLTIPPMTDRALPPVIVLLSDGQPTDNYKKSLDKLLQLPWGKKAVRIAISIGQDADDNVLQEFTGNRELVLQANNPQALVKMIKWASTAASLVSAPASRAKEVNDVDTSSTNAPLVLDMNNIPDPADIDADDVWYVAIDCNNCEYHEIKEIIPKIEHTPVIDESKPATCTETGLTEGSHCSVCGDVIKAQEIIPSLGHTEVIDKEKPATCTETGLTEGSHCSVCGEVIKKQENVPALGHTVVVDEGKPATCTESGLTEGSHCSVCGEILQAQDVIPALNHTVVTDAGYPASCTEAGLTDGEHCSVCGMVIKEQEVVPAKGHTEATDEAKPATCTETGLTEGSHCSVCGEVFKLQEEVPALGHKPIIDSAVQATCQHEGHTIGSHCEHCGLVYVEPKVIPKLPHSIVTDEAVAPSCTETGLTEGSHCSECGEVFVEQSVIPALNHSYEAVEGIPATHYHTGLTDGIRCSRCGDWLIKQEIIPMLEPSFIMGDVNGDGKVSIDDATLIQKSLAELEKLTPEQENAADANADGRITIDDVTQIQKYIAELIDHLG